MAAALAAAAFVVSSAMPARAQPLARQGRGGQPAAGVSPIEVQRMFDAYALVQAQEALELTDQQYPQFLTRFRALQETRRRHEQDRLRIIQGLRVMTAGPDAHPNEAQLEDQLKALEELDARAAADVRNAYDALDRVLDVVQRARFRVFEQQMERRKLELLIRARQGARRNPM
ncbi:MAG: hypothetical protein ACM3SQ_14650 [Betaproteobacteria bacterium]